jgi:peptide subunit release factor 1 (eRF1)
MAALVSGQFQMLLDQPKSQAMMVSCYADTSVSEGFAAHWLQPFKTEASRIGQQLGDDPQARREFERNVDVIRRALESPVVRQARGMAVFSSMTRGFFLALPASEPYENRLVVAEQPYVVPLLEADFRQRGYLVVLADMHRARLSAAGPGGSRVLDVIDAAVPKKQHSAGERWGKQQATIERHRRDHVLPFQKALVRCVEEAWDDYPYQGIVLLGQHQILEQFRNLLPARLSSRVVHEAPQAWTEEEAEIDEKVRAVLETAQQAEGNRVLEELDRRLHEATAVATGPQEVIDALMEGQVAELILGPDSGTSASHCTRCHTLFAASHAVCPYCHGHCRTENLWQAILEFAVRHSIWVHRVRPSVRLACHGGVAALLARNEPPWATAPHRLSPNVEVSVAP